MKILCIDIGGSRIKSAVIPSDLAFIDYKNIIVKTVRNDGWINQSMPDLLKSNFILDQGKFDTVAIAVSGQFAEDGSFLRKDLVNDCNVPKYLCNEFQKRTDAKVSIVNDSEAWIRGAIHFSRSIGAPTFYKSSCLVLGTGVALSLALSERKILLKEINDLKAQFSNLSKACGQGVWFSAEVHSMVGNAFFSWVKKERKTWDRQTIKFEYTKRVKALIVDLVQIFRQEKGEIKQFYIGGGNVEFLLFEDLHQAFPEIKFTSLKEEAEAKLINPDFVPLLGLASIYN